jgi:DNA-binding beta-propeller fold protein YncE
MIEILQKCIPAHRRLTQGTMVLAAVAGLAGCGSNYRPTTTPITGSGPAAQPSAYAFVISTPSASEPGIATVIDYSGDTVMATAPIGPGPVTFNLSSSGSQAWTLDSDGTVANIPVSTSLQSKNVFYSTLNAIPAAGTVGDLNGIDPVVQLFSGSAGFYALDTLHNEVDVLTGSPDAFKLVVPVDISPVTMEGVTTTSRYYAISQLIPYLSTSYSLDGSTVDGGVACNIDPHASGLPNGMADAIETSTYTVSAKLQVGVCPVYAVGTPDTRRVFVLNRGSDSVSVINSQNNTIDACTCPPGGCVNQNGSHFVCHPSLPLTPASGKAHAGPVYAEYNPATEQLIVANYEGNSINIIDVSLDEYGNDSSTFGTTFTVPVGYNPGSVTVLADGSRAYVANQAGDLVNGTSSGSVTIVNLSSHTVEKTLPVQGYPRTVVSTMNSLYGKVYAVSPDSPYVSIIRTDQDILSTTVLVQGNAIDVRTTSPDTSSNNANTVSRLPGAGQPCYLPPSAFTAAGAPLTVANCKVQDPTQFSSAAQ